MTHCKKLVVLVALVTLCSVLFAAPAAAYNSYADLEDELNANYSWLDTPMGSLSFEHTVTGNTNEFFGYDFRIYTDWFDEDWFESDSLDVGDCFSPYALKYSNAYTRQEKEETLRLLRAFQRSVYAVAAEYYPDQKIQGGFHHGYYRYRYLEIGYSSTTFLSWNNYSVNSPREEWEDSTVIDEFKWDDFFDSYKF